LGERGWLAASWPVEFGGLGKTVVEAAIVTEEMAFAGVPDDAHCAVDRHTSVCSC
jgi:alkylation response protein AidB-like acyl-CoA dehydrogenase